MFAEKRRFSRWQAFLSNLTKAATPLQNTLTQGAKRHKTARPKTSVVVVTRTPHAQQSPLDHPFTPLRLCSKSELSHSQSPTLSHPRRVSQTWISDYHVLWRSVAGRRPGVPPLGQSRLHVLHVHLHLVLEGGQVLRGQGVPDLAHRLLQRAQLERVHLGVRQVLRHTGHKTVRRPAR